MRVPEDAPKDIYEYEWLFSEGDEIKKYITNGGILMLKVIF